MALGQAKTLLPDRCAASPLLWRKIAALTLVLAALLAPFPSPWPSLVTWLAIWPWSDFVALIESRVAHRPKVRYLDANWLASPGHWANSVASRNSLQTRESHQRCVESADLWEWRKTVWPGSLMGERAARPASHFRESEHWPLTVAVGNDCSQASRFGEQAVGHAAGGVRVMDPGVRRPGRVGA